MRFATQGLVDNRHSPTNWEEQGPFRRPMLNVAGAYGQPSNMPDYVYESLRRQMGPGYGFGDYKTEDMKNVINWNAGRLRV